MNRNDKEIAQEPNKEINNTNNEVKKKDKHKKEQIKIVVLRCVFLSLLIATLILIFGFSGQNGETSGNLSQKITEIIIKIFDPDNVTTIETIKQIEKVIRKLAHFSIYTLVGIWSMSFMLTLKINKNKMAIISGITGFIYACSDELHQLFINGRAGSFLDVTIDTMGVIFGILVTICIIKIKNITKTLQYH